MLRIRYVSTKGSGYGFGGKEAVAVRVRKAGYGSVQNVVVMETVGWIIALGGGLVGLDSYRYLID